MTKRLNKYFSLILFLAVILFSLNSLSSKASADTVNVTATENWSNCIGSVNGVVSGDQSPPVYYGVANGQTVNLTINNTSSSETLDITVNGQSIPTPLAPNGSYTNQYTASNVITVFATDSSCNDKADYSNFDIENGSGSMTCTLSGKVWNINGQFSNVVSPVYMYRGNTYVYSYNTTNNSLTISNLQFAAESSSATYYLYNGTGQNFSQIGSATCAPIVTASSSNTAGGASSTAKLTPVKASSTANTKSATSQAKSGTNNLIYYNPLASKGKNYKFTTGMLILLIVTGLLLILTLISTALVFRKAGRPVWAAIVPVYNSWLIYEMGGQDGWWSLIMLIPIANLVALVMYVIAEIEIAKRFSKGPVFAVLGLFIFWFIGWPLLAFSDAKYTLPSVSTPKP